MNKILRVLLSLTLVFISLVAVSSTYAGDLKTTKPNFMASISKPILEKAYGYIWDKDSAAFEKVFKTGLVIILKPGLRVYVVESDWGGYIKIRPKGNTLELWTLREAVE